MTTRRTTGTQAQAAKSAFHRSEEPTRPLYQEIFTGMPVGVLVLHLSEPEDPGTFRIIDLNPAVASLTGSALEELRGRTLSEFPKLLKSPFAHGCIDAFRSRSAKDLGEISFGDERIHHGIYSVQVFPLYDHFLGVVFANVTVQSRSERESRESEERFRLLVQNVQEYAIFQLDPLGQIVSWNGGAERLKGYSADEIIGKQLAVFYPPEDVKSGKPARLLAEAAQRGQCEDEGWRVRKDGSRFWANVVVTALRNSKGILQGFAKVTRDMTDKHGKEEQLEKAKELLELRFRQRTAVLAQVNHELRTEIGDRQRAEEQSKASLEQLRSLAGRLQSVREEERTSIAREIHDELGQSCTALKMDLALIGRKATRKQTQLRAKVESATKLIDEMIATLRRIASELRPRTLDDLGLNVALEGHALEFQNRTGIRCQVTLPEVPLVLDRDRSTAIFRIFQESLTNVARHSQATRVEARLEREANSLIFWVHDNGIGFDPEAVKSRGALGLIGMRERALLLNGELKMEGAPGDGTTLTLRIPIASPALPSLDEK
jgi:PAS domain S-box-containing protein